MNNECENVMIIFHLMHALFSPPVDTSKHMVGSYGPKTEPHLFTTKPDEAPSGMMGRGTYTIKSKFTDDDKNIYLEWEWALTIAKDWPA